MDPPLPARAGSTLGLTGAGGAVSRVTSRSKEVACSACGNVEE